MSTLLEDITAELEIVLRDFDTVNTTLVKACKVHPFTQTPAAVRKLLARIKSESDTLTAAQAECERLKRIEDKCFDLMMNAGHPDVAQMAGLLWLVGQDNPAAALTPNP